MKNLIFSYEAPEIELVDAKLSYVLCESNGEFGNENFTDGNWEW